MSEKLHAAAAAAAGAAATPLRREASLAAPVFEVPADKLLHDWKQAHARAIAYMDALAIPPSEREALAAEAIARALRAQRWDADSDAVTETLRAIDRKSVV